MSTINYNMDRWTVVAEMLREANMYNNLKLKYQNSTYDTTNNQTLMDEYTAYYLELAAIAAPLDPEAEIEEVYKNRFRHEG